jgi:hypothetical protein
MEAWDHKRKLWKVWEFQKKWSETFSSDWQEPIQQGRLLDRVRVDQVSDVQNDRGTIWIGPGGFPSTEGPEAPSYKASTNSTSIVNSRPPGGKAAGG